MGKRLSQRLSHRKGQKAILFSMPQEDLLESDLLQVEAPGLDKTHLLVKISLRPLTNTFCYCLCQQSSDLSVLQQLSVWFTKKP